MENIQSVIDQFPELSPEFRFWLWQMPGKRLNRLIESLISSGEANNYKEAVQYLNSIGKIKDANNIIITLSDINCQKSQLVKKFEQLVGAQNKNDCDPYAAFGTANHILMQEIASGRIFARSRYRQTDTEQLSLLEKSDQLSLFGDRNNDFLYPYSNDPISFRKIQTLWRKITEKITTRSWPDWYWACSTEIKELQNQLHSLLPGKHSRLLFQCSKPSFEQVATLSLMSLTAALIHFRKNGPMNIFSEIPIFKPQRDGLSGGRIDALELQLAKNEPLSKKHLRALNTLKGLRFDSINSLVNAITRTLQMRPDEFAFKIWDWKFSIGDGQKRQMIKTEDIPLPEHLVQLSKYLTLASISYFLGNDKNEEMWQNFTDGRLMYIMPTVQPVIHAIKLSPAEKETTFLKEIVLHWNSAQRMAIQRVTDNAIFGHVIKLLEGRQFKNGEEKNYKRQLSLFGEKESTEVKPVVRFVEKYRFVDKYNILERAATRKSKKEILFLHVDKLLENIREGKIAAKSINQAGGFVSCLSPDHLDHTPSLHISFARGIFKCFSCGIHGLLVSIPKELQSQEKNIWGDFQRTKTFPSFQKAVIPKEHHRIMTLAQELLHSRFWESPAVKYIKEDRCIDPTLAFEYGAGFGDDSFIDGLLDAGLNLDQLIHFGFVSISSRLTSDRGIGPLLKKRGMSAESFRREIKLVIPIRTKGSGPEIKNVAAYPYSALNGRVTFPLNLGGDGYKFLRESYKRKNEA